MLEHESTPGKTVYQTWLVRFWRAETAEQWHGTLEDPHSGETLHFPDQQALLDYVQDRLTVAPERRTGPLPPSPAR